MAEPIIVTSSTSLIEVNTLETPFTEVRISSLVYTGQTFSVVDNTGLSNIVAEPILISTVFNYNFQDTGKLTVSTLIDQPYGFVTFASQLPSTFTILNSFPLRQQFVSAGLMTLNTSSLLNTITSTAFENVSSIRVENMTITSSFLQSTGLTITTNISTTGALNLASSLTVYGPTFFSSALSTFGFVSLASTLEVSSLTTLSSLVVQGSMSLGGSLLVFGQLSVPNVYVGNELQAGRLEVQGSTTTTLIASDVLIQGSLKTHSSLTVGENFITETFFLQDSLSTLGGMRASTLTIQGGTDIYSTLRVLGNVSTGGDLLVVGPFSTSSDIFTQSTLVLFSTLDIAGSLSANQIIAGESAVSGSAAFQSTTVGTSATVEGSVGHTGFFTFTGTSQFLSSILVGSNLLVETRASLLNLSTQSNMVVTTDFTKQLYGSIESNVSVGGQLSLERLVGFGGATVANGLYVTNNALDIDGNVQVGGRLVVIDQANINTFTLPENFQGNSFGADIALTGTSTSVSTAFVLSSLLTSSFAIGLPWPATTVEMSNNRFHASTLEANLVSTGSVLITSDTSVGAVSILSSLGVGTNPGEYGLYVNAPSYGNDTWYISTLFSTNSIQATNFIGAHKGDGSLLSNIPFPENAVTSSIITSSFSTTAGFFSTVITSTLLVNERFFPQSTVQLRDFSLLVNAPDYNVEISTNYLAALPDRRLWLNSTLLVSTNHVAINATTTSELYSLFVNNTLRVKGFQDYPINIRQVEVGDLYASTVTVVGSEPTIISSGLIILSNLVFLPEGESIESRSTHVLTTHASTILIDDIFSIKAPSSIGILTKEPNYEIDIGGSLRVSTDTTYASSFQISGQLTFSTVSQRLSTIYIGTGSNSPGLSKLRYSTDLINWEQIPAFATAFGPYSNIMTSVAYSAQTGLWLTVGRSSSSSNPYIWYSQDGLTWSNTGMTTASVDPSAEIQPTDIKWNGAYWLMTASNGTNNPALTLWQSATGSNNVWSSRQGMVGSVEEIAWNGFQWIGVGSNSSPSGTEPQYIQSVDGNNWSSNGTGQVSQTVLWDGRRWIATYSNLAQTFITSSYDGSNWEVLASTSMSIANAMAYNGENYVMVGMTPSTILYSPDAREWFAAEGRLFQEEGLSILWDEKQFVAGGQDGIRRSQDGKTWEADIIPSTVLVIGGPSNGTPGTTLYYSSNAGLAWSKLTTPLQNYVSGVVYDSATSIWVAVGCNTNQTNNIVYSSNGLDWFLASGPPMNEFSFSNGNSPIAVNPGAAPGDVRFVATGEALTIGNTSIIYSLDGINWDYAIGPSARFESLRGLSVTYGNNTWVAVGEAFFGTELSTIRYSSDGSNWNIATIPVGNNTDLYRSVTYNPAVSRFVAVGQGVTSNNTIVYSDNGQTWLAANNSFLEGRSVVAGANVFVAAGTEPISVVDVLKTSSDGINWTNTYFGSGAGSWVSVSFTGGVFYSAADISSFFTFLQSQNGSAWDLYPAGLVPDFPFAPFTFVEGSVSTLIENYPFYGLGYNSNIKSLIDIGDKITIPRRVEINNSAFYIGDSNFGSGSNLARSTDGETYQLIPGTLCNAVLGITINPTTGTYVLVGQGTPYALTNDHVMYSFNGLSWNFATGFLGFGVSAYDVAYGTNLFVVVLESNVVYSGTGITWSNTTGFPSGFGPPLANGVGTDSNGSWVVVGRSDGISQTSIYYSDNGSNYFSNVTGSFSNGRGNKVAYGNGTWVAVGQGFDVSAPPYDTIKYTTNRTAWANATNGFTFEGYGIAFNGSLWIACGSNNPADASTIKYSGDGINWSDVPSGAFDGSSPNGVGFAATWTGTEWYAVGRGVSGNVMRSSDGINWSFVTVTGVTNPQTIKYIARPIETELVADRPSTLLTLFEEPQSQTILQYSTNSMAVYQSTLALNNTLFMNVSSQSLAMPSFKSGNISSQTFFVDGSVRISSVLFLNTFTPPNGVTLPIEYI